MDDYNQRQYRRMLAAIDIFFHHQGLSTLGEITNDLEALLGAIEVSDPAWAEQFWREWSTLEQVYSFVVTEARRSLSEQEIEWVIESLNKLKMLIVRKITPD